MTPTVRPLRAAVLWVVFMLMCAGLGYPTLRRYDPRDRRVNFDTATRLYHWQVTGDPGEGVYEPSLVHYRYRLLVPTLARPFYMLGQGKIGTWDPGYFGMLIASASLCASSALLLFAIGVRVAGDRNTALIGSLLYLLSFAVPNFHLSGLIDSGEALMLVAVVWCLYAERWALLPLVAVPGVLAKETFLPFSVAIAAGWLIATWRERSSPERMRALLWCALLAVSGVVTLVCTFSIANGRLVLPWELQQSGLPPNLQRTLPERAVFLTHDLNLLYFFGWLAPLAAVSLRRCPRPWVVGAGLAAFTALMLGIYNGEPGISRALFNITGPLLSLASALTLVMLVTGPRATATR